MTSKCGKNVSDTLGYASCATFLFFPHFDVICDLLLNRRTATWNLFVNLTSQTSLHACLQRLNTMQISLWHHTRNRPMPLTSSVMWQMMARFRNFYKEKKVKTYSSLQRRSAFWTGAKIYFSKKIFWGYGQFKGKDLNRFSHQLHVISGVPVRDKKHKQSCWAHVFLFLHVVQ